MRLTWTALLQSQYCDISHFYLYNGTGQRLQHASHGCWGLNALMTCSACTYTLASVIRGDTSENKQSDEKKICFRSESTHLW